MKYHDSVRAVLVNFPQSMVDDRRRLGIDKSDERWDGEWHFVNPPRSWHNRLNCDMYEVLAPLARRRGLEPFGDCCGIFGDPESNWRIPDQVYCRPEDVVEVGVVSAEFVVEVHSPGGEAYEKLPYFAERGVSEVLIVHEDRRFELRRLGADKTYALVDDGRSEALGVPFSTVDGPRLRIEWDRGSAEV